MDVGGFLAASVPLLLMPGGGFALLVRWVLAAGRRGGVLVAVGSVTALAVQLCVAAGALAALGTHVDQVGPLLDVAGGFVMVLLGVRAVQARPAAPRPPRSDRKERLALAPVAEAFGVGVLNPKGLVVYAVMAPRFMPTDVGSHELVLLGTAHLALVGVWLAVLATGVASVVSRTGPGRRRQVELLCGAILVGYGIVWMLPALVGDLARAL